MKQCTTCLSENVSTIVENNRIFYYCSNCQDKNTQVIDNDGQNYSSKENGLIKHISISAIIEKNSSVLLTDRQKFPFGFGIPSAHMHIDETPKEALSRLFIDKIGLNLTKKQLILHQTLIDPCRYGAELHECYVYRCKVKDFIFIGSKEDNLSFIKINDLPKADLISNSKIIFSRINLLGKNKDLITYPKIERNENINENSIIDGLPFSIIIFNKSGKTSFANNTANLLLQSIKNSGKEDYNKFVNSVSEIAKSSIKNETNVSGVIKNKADSFNIIATPLRNKKRISGSTIVIKDITRESENEAHNVIAYQTSLALTSKSNYQGIIKTVLKQIFNAMNVMGASLMLKEGDKLKVTYNYSSLKTAKHKPFVLKIGEGIAGQVAEKRMTLAIPDTHSDPLFVAASYHKSRSLLSVPVISDGIVLGVLNLTKKRNKYFTEGETQTATLVANRIALAIENDRLYTRLSNDKKTLETVLSTTTDGLILLDRNLKLIFANEAAIAINRLTQDEVKNHHINNFIKRTSDKNIRKFLTAVRKSINMRKQLTFEFVSQRGPEKVVKTVFNPIVEKDGKCNSVLIGFNNITKVKQKQALVQKKVKQITALFKISSISYDSSERFLSGVLDKAKEILEAEEAGIKFIDNNLAISSSENQSLERIIKLKRFAISKSKQGLIFNNAKKELPCQNILRILIVPLRSNNKIMGYIYATDKKTHFNSEDLRLLNIIAAGIVSRLQSVMLINQLESDWQKIHNVIESTADGIVAIDKNRNTVFWNKSMEEITGFANIKEYMAKNLDRDDFIKNIFIEANKTKGDFHIKKRIDVINADDQKIWVDITYSVVKNKQGRGEIIVIALRDASKEVEIETQQKEFIYTATHELRTPITAIKGYLSMILEGDAGEINDTQKQYFSRAYTGTERLVALVEDLLKTTRLEENKMHYNKGIIDAQKLIDEVLEDFNKKAEGKDLVISKKIKKKNVKLFGDYDLTKHALSNLIDNAIKYTKKSGEIEVCLESKNKSGIISVQDSGVGIPLKEQPHIFSKFHRVYNSESVSAGGTGLGLFIVKNLIENQGGSVNIKSKLGVGSTFSIALPLAKK